MGVPLQDCLTLLATTPITVHQSEKVGSFHPVEITAGSTHFGCAWSRPPMSESIRAEVDAAIAKMMSGIEDLTWWKKLSS